MKLLCASNSVSFALSLRIALEAEDIEVFCTDPDLALGSIAGPIAGGGGRVYVLHESDWPRAVEILTELAPQPAAAARKERSSKPIPMWLIVVLSALGIALLGAMVTLGEA